MDLSAQRLDDVDLSGSRLHGANLEGTRITDGWLRDASISGCIDGLVVNGVEVAPLVAAELDRREPERILLRSTDPEGLARAWAVIEGRWQGIVERAERLPAADLVVRVDGEWSFLETLRHLVFATDCWLGRMVRQEPRPYHRFGIAPSFLTDPSSIGLDGAAEPSLAEVAAVRRERMDAVASTIATVTPRDLERVCEPPLPLGPPEGPHTVLQCLQAILEEEWEHARYAVRDLDVLSEAP
jgi:hypothetical protein